MRDLRISVGDDFASGVTSISMSWQSLVLQLSTVVDTGETMEQYKKFSKDEQLRTKDRGWWNGATYEGTHRNAQKIQSFDVLTFDLDHCTPATPTALRTPLAAYTCFMGSTHAHTAQLPRLRLAFPTTRTVSVDEADAIKRMIAELLGMKLADAVSFRANQIMFWPSRCKDGEVITEAFDGAWLDPDAFLATYYLDWTDRGEWPVHPDEPRSATAEKSGKRSDPRDRDDLIGLFCRLYDVEAAMDEFIPGTYFEGTQAGRYTYAEGSAANGAVLYEGGLYLYSNHGTDPANGLLCNAWDLVRLHKFNERDAQAKPGTETAKLPSQDAMREWVMALPEVRATHARETMSLFEPVETKADALDLAAILGDDFDLGEAADPLIALFERLTLNKRGKVMATYDNLLTIITDHPAFKGSLSHNHNLGADVWRKAMPWHDAFALARQGDETEGIAFIRDVDELEVRDFIVRQFKGAELPSLATVKNICIMVAQRHGFHPIRDAFEALPEWDGANRLDSALVRYLACEDNAYTRAISRKFFCAIVARALQPGIKFDHMLLLIGPQGQMKSTFCEVIAGNVSWFRGTLPPIAKMPDVVSAIRSKLICEWSDLHGMGSAEIESIKAFVSERRDEVRLAYGRQTLPYPRQAVLIGTSNDDTPLRDRTGNRRFWPVHVNVGEIDTKSFARERDQILAEAKVALAAGETLYLIGDAKEGAQAAQEAARDIDPNEEAIHGWLDGTAPSRGFPAGSIGNEFETAAQRHDLVCLRQVACEALGLSETGVGWPPYMKRLIAGVLKARQDFHQLPTTRYVKGYGSVRVWERKVERVKMPGQRTATVTPIHTKAQKEKAALFDI